MQSEAVALLVQATEKAMQLFSVRAERRKRYLTEMIDPVYQQLWLVAADYHNFFCDCERLVEETLRKRTDLTALVNKIQDSRDKHLLARRQVVALADAIALEFKPDEPETEFANKVRQIFFCTLAEVEERTVLKDPGRSSRASHVLASLQASANVDSELSGTHQDASTRTPRTGPTVQLPPVRHQSTILKPPGAHDVYQIDLLDTQPLTDRMIVLQQIRTAKKGVEEAWTGAASAYAKLKMKYSGF